MEKNLYRLEQGKKIAGVCSGLGDYFQIDPILFRILFILLIFASGFGLIVYLILWLALPLKETEEKNMSVKRLTLSKTDKKIAGVCGGLGEYFSIDPVIFRIIFLVSILFGGLGLLLYVILWILIPAEA